MKFSFTTENIKSFATSYDIRFFRSNSIIGIWWNSYRCWRFCEFLIFINFFKIQFLKIRNVKTFDSKLSQTQVSTENYPKNTLISSIRRFSFTSTFSFPNGSRKSNDFAFSSILINVLLFNLKLIFFKLQVKSVIKKKLKEKEIQFS